MSLNGVIAKFWTGGISTSTEIAGIKWVSKVDNSKFITDDEIDLGQV